MFKKKIIISILCMLLLVCSVFSLTAWTKYDENKAFSDNNEESEQLVTIANEIFAESTDISLLAATPTVASVGTVVSRSGKVHPAYDVTYEFIVATGVLTISGTGEMPDYSSSSFYPWYDYRDSVKSVVIEDQVTTISDYAFQSCDLASISIGKGVKSIGTHAFSNNSDLGRVVIPDNVTTIGESAFASIRSLSSVTIGKGVTNIGNNAFYSSAMFNDHLNIYIADMEKWLSIDFASYIPSHNLYLNNKIVKELHIPTGIVQLKQYALANCDSLEKVVLHDSISQIGKGAFYLCSSLETVECGRAISLIDELAFYSCSLLKDLTFYGENLLTIDNSAFANCEKLESIALPSSLTTIGNSAFYSSGLKSINIPKSVSTIGVSVFGGCSELASICVENGNAKFYALNNCLIDSSTGTLVQACSASSIPNDSRVTSIGSYAFSGYSMLESINIPSNISIIGDYAFKGCSGLQELIIPDTVDSIGCGALSGCYNLQKLTIPFVGYSRTATAASAKTLFGYIFGSDYFPKAEQHFQYYSSSSEDYYIPTQLKSVVVTGGSLWYGAFYGCDDITQITIENVNSIGEKAFCYCSCLSSVNIGTGLNNIGSNAFSNCSALNIIIFEGNAPSIGKTPFPTTDATKFMIVYEAGATGWTTPAWNSYACYPMNGVEDFATLDENNKNAQGIKFTLNSNGTAFVGDGTTTANNSEYAGGNGGIVKIPAFVVDSTGTNYRVVGVGQYAFSNNAMVRTVELPSTILSIPGDHAFYACANLERFILDSKCTALSVDENGVLFNKNGSLLVSYPAASTVAEYTVPSTVDQIKEGAFSGVKHLESIILPFIGARKNITSASELSLLGYIFGGEAYTGGVKTYQYYNGSKHSIYYIPSCLKSVTVNGGNIYYGAFYNCTGLSTIKLSSNIETVAAKSFYGCSGLVNLTLPFVGADPNATVASENTLLGYIFGDARPSTGSWKETNQYYSSTQYKTYYIPTALSHVEILGGNILYGAFFYCDYIDSVILPEGLTSIGDKAFYCCYDLNTIEIPSSLQTIGSSAFANCEALTAIEIPSAVSKIGHYAFENTAIRAVYINDIASWCNINFSSSLSNPLVNAYLYLNGQPVTNLVIPYGVEKINNYAFIRCRNIETITLPNSITEIGEYAFCGLYRLGDIVIPKSIKTLGASAFASCSNIQIVSFEANCNIETIGNSAFSGCTSLHSINWGIGNNIKKIYTNAFSSCTSLTEIDLPNGLEYIGSGAFANCKNVTNIYVPNTVTEIWSEAFKNCIALEHITLPFLGNKASSTTTLLGYVFGTSAIDGCKAVTQYSSATSAGTTYYIPASLKTIEITGGNISYGAFYNCSQLNTVLLPESISQIGDCAFYNCSGLTNISIPSTVTTIGKDAFNGCDKIQYIQISDNVTSLGENAFKGCVSLIQIEFGKNISNMSAWDFASYTKLEKIIVSDNNPTYSSDGWGVLYNKAKTTLYVYPQNRAWPYYNIPTTVTTISSNAFKTCQNLFVLLIPKETVTLSNNCISGCGNISLNVYADSAALTYAENNSINYNIIDDMTLTGIEVYSTPYKSEFVKGTEFDFDGLYLVGYYSDGSVMQISDYVLDYDANKVGTQSVKVTYLGFETSFEITVRDKNAIGIEVAMLPSKLIYSEGVALDVNGLSVYLVYEDSTKELIDPTLYIVTSPDMTILGEHRVTISYGEFETTYPVYVHPKTILSIIISSEPNKKEYVIGDMFSSEGIVITVIYDNNTQEDVSDYYITGYDMSQAGTQNVTVSYQGFVISFEIYVEKKEQLKAISPTVESYTDTSVTLTLIEGMEYSIDGIHWQTSNTFNYLDPHTSYTFYQRYYENDTYKAGECSNGLTKTTKYTLTGYVGISGTFIEGGTLQATIDTIEPFDADITYTWQRDGVDIEGATNNTYVLQSQDIGCQITVSIIATGEYYGTIKSKALVSAPAAPTVLSITSSCVSLQAVEGYEYSKDGGVTWQTSNVFENLSFGATYSFCQRVKESDTIYVSASSAPIEFETLNVYSVIIKDEDGTVLSESTVDEGSLLLMPNEPSKSASEHYTYSFVGWDFNNDGIPDNVPETVTSNISAKAVYSSNCKHISSSWVKADNSDIESYACDNCSAVFETRTGHVYSDWSQHDTANHKRECACGYVDYEQHTWNNGTIISTQTCTQDGETAYICITCGATKTETTNKLGHEIAHHDAKEETCTTVGWEAYDTCNRCSYTTYVEIPATGHNYVDGHCTNNCGDVLPYIVFRDYNGTIISGAYYHYGATVVIPNNPTRASDNTFVYAFAGWDKDVVACAGDATYTATYNSTYIDYTVIFKNENGAVLSTNTYHYGDTVTPPTPTKAADSTYTYTFKAWDKTVTNCVGDATYTATYEASYIDYIVIFKNEDGTVLSTNTYHYGDDVIEPQQPTKNSNHIYTYEFNGWNQEVKKVSGNTTYIATYLSTYIEYTVVFKNEDGTNISSTKYHYGQKVSVPSNPTKPADETYTYLFNGWDNIVVTVNGDATYTATYRSVYINYVVEFKNDDGAVISTNTYHYGDTVTAPAAPIKAADNTYTYTFKAWDKTIVDCAGNATYTATYDLTYIDYTVIFKNEDGTVLSTNTYHYGDEVVAPTAPTKAADNTYTYSFKAWDSEVVACAGNATYTATYESTYIDYTVVFKDENGTVLSTNTYHYGDEVVAPTAPTKEADDEYTYTFAGWDEEIVACAGDATYTATYSATEIEDTQTPGTDTEPGTESNTPSDNDTNDENDGLSGGAVAGIVAGSAVGGSSLLWFVIKKKRFSIKKK